MHPSASNGWMGGSMDGWLDESIGDMTMGGWVVDGYIITAHSKDDVQEVRIKIIYITFKNVNTIVKIM
jgi:hypothetical protein